MSGWQPPQKDIGNSSAPERRVRSSAKYDFQPPEKDILAGPVDAPKKAPKTEGWVDYIERKAGGALDTIGNATGIDVIRPSFYEERARSGEAARDAAVNEGVWDRIGSLLEKGMQGTAAGLDSAVGASTGSDRLLDRGAALRQAAGSSPIAGDITGDQVWQDPSLQNIGGFIANRAVESAPAMVPYFINPLLGAATTVGSTTGNVAADRAMNDGRGTEISGTDLAIGGATALPVAALDLVGFKGMTGKGGFLDDMISQATRAPVRVGGAALGEAGTEAGQEFLENVGSTAGTEKGFELKTALKQSAEAALAGGGMGAGMRGTVETGSAIGTRFPALREFWKGKGVETDAMGDGDLEAFTLDETGNAAADIDEILKNGGAAPEQFSTPEVAQRMAERMAAAQGRQPANLAEGLPAKTPNTAKGFNKVADGLLNTESPSRVVPDDVSIINNPEGNVRSDDMGAQTALDRKRAGDDNVLNQAQQAAADDPVIGEILNSNVSTQTKIATVWDRINQRNAGTRDRLDDPVDGVPTPEELAERTGLNDLQRTEPWRRSTAGDAGQGPIGYQAPFADDKISSNFGRRVAPKKGASSNHKGTDYAVPMGTPIRPVADGEVVFAGKRGGYGNQIRVRHADGTESSYSHLSGIGVKAGDRVGRDSNMGASGMSGTATGPHLHLEIRRNGQAIDPQSVFNGKAEAPVMRGQEAAAPNWADNPSEGAAERTQQQASPSEGEFAQGDVFQDRDGIFGERRRNAQQYEAPMGTGSGQERGQPFKAVDDDPDGNPGFWESEATRMQEEFRAKAKAREEEAKASANGRYNQERAKTADAKDTYGGYDQKPEKAGDFWRTTDDGYVAGKNGKPAAFRNAREAAKWAAQNKMGGDFEMESYGTSKRGQDGRIVLKKRANSSYGTAQPEADPAAGPEAAAADDAGSGTGFKQPQGFERTVPPAGRSSDGSQRAIGGEVGPDAPPADNVAPEAPQGPSAAPFVAPKAGGPDATRPTERVVTANGKTEIDTEFEVVDANDLITSDNAGFDQTLQPRDRAGRRTSDAQIADRAANLDPAQLGRSRLASTGAPIVGANNMVESGNGRTSFIRRAYESNPEGAAKYRAMIDEMGFDITGMERPVLIRRRKSEMSPEDLRQFTVDAQDAGVMRMSAPEQADADAKSIDADMMKLYKGGDPAGAGNADFARAYAAKAVSADDLNTMVKADGTLSADGATRLRRALTQRAYGDQRFLDKITNDEDTDIKAIGNVLVDVAPELGVIKDRVAAGELPSEFDIAPQLKEIADLISKSRSTKTPLKDLLEQSDIFAGDVDPMTKELAGIMMEGEGYTKPRSAAAMKKGLQTFLRDVSAAKKDMFGGDMKKRAVDMAAAARKKTESGGQSDMFGGRAKMFGGGKGSNAVKLRLRDELSKVARGATNRRYRELAAKLRDLATSSMTIEYGAQGLIYKSTRGEADGATGEAFVKNRGDVEVILHEAIHVISIGKYGEDFANVRDADAAAPHARELLRLFAEARKMFASRPRNTMFGPMSETVKNGLENVDEFLAYSLTSPKFQKWMEQGTLFDRFADGLRKMFGLEPKFKPILARALRAGTDLLDAASIDGKMTPPVRSFGKAEPVAARAASKETKGLWGKLADNVADFDALRDDVGAFKEAIGEPLTTLQKFTEPMGRMISAGFFTNDARLRGLAGYFNSSSIEELANKFHARAGADDATGRDYHAATMRAATSRSQRAFDILGPLVEDEAAMKRIRDMLTNPKSAVRAKSAEAEAAREISKLLKETLEYRRDAGESIGEVSDGYFPRMLDNEAVVKERDKFLAAAEKLYRGIGVPDAAESAAAWYERIFDSYAGLDGGLDHIKGANGGIGTSSAKAREFGKQADVLLKEFYNQDTFGTLAAYFTGSAKRAEYNRRFGKPGREGSPERNAWVKEHGDKTQLQDLFDRMKADVKASGKDPAGYAQILENVMKSQLGQMGTKDPFARNAVSYLHAWNQLGKMDRSMVTSLGEITMGFIRGGPRYGFPFLKDTVTEFGRQLAKADPSDAARWGEALGVTNDAMVNQVLTSRIDAQASSAGVQKTLASFYKAIGLHQFTEATRIASVKMGQKFISDLVGDLDSPKPRTRTRAKFYLKELGISDVDGFAKGLKNAEVTMQNVLEDKGGIASDYGTAMNRFVNQTIMVPSRAEKPTWAAHPVGSLMFSLMSYSYGFKKNVLDRGGRLAIEGVKQKDPAMMLPAASLLIMIAFQGLNDTYLRPLLFGSNYDFEKETPMEMFLRVIDRSGVTGALSPFVNAIKAVKYDRSILESLSGPVVGSIANAVQKVAIEPFTDRNSKNTNTAERNAATAFYDTVLEPMADGFAAARLKGVVKSAAILSTGNREGGVLPADKDLVVDTLAGEKEDD